MSMVYLTAGIQYFGWQIFARMVRLFLFVSFLFCVYAMNRRRLLHRVYIRKNDIKELHSAIQIKLKLSLINDFPYMTFVPF